ncbi:hypothetical protein CAEBREN_19935 [Caenorhabditis brenneri]|uniref:Uncharacterized protein n=1 Tax=Caenorhabditis brenneri TaxID=135651 RepID=G0NKF8_CAEBE|nr:hypothetical protein CAEBREN_19935 [Caenorhabditis brenneri]
MVDPPLPPLPTNGKQSPAQPRKSRQPNRPARQNPIAPKRKQENKAARRQQAPPNPILDQQQAMAEMAESLMRMMMEALIPEAPLVVEDDPLPEEMELHPMAIPRPASDVLRRARASVRNGYYVKRGQPADPPQEFNQEGRWDEQDVARARALLVSYLQCPQEDNLIQQPQQ